MNVFEDLIEELKGEDLLEETVTEIKRAEAVERRRTVPQPTATFDFAKLEAASAHTHENIGGGVSHAANTPAVRPITFDADFCLPGVTGESGDDADFYRKRAVDEVAGLQMVERVISAIEREHMKIVPKMYDDLKVKKALHAFVKLGEAPMSPAHMEAQGLVMLETEAWCMALSERDANISVGNVRRFCENSRPVLSSQALLALARFYRVVPFSEPVRSKFDFVMTRLFSRDAGLEKRRAVFSRAETAGHIQDMYDNWSSLSLFDTVEDDSNAKGAVATFENFVKEAEEAESFNELMKNEFFDRTRLFKESLGELVFVPEVTAAAIDCNVRIGNRFVDLIIIEKAKLGIDTIEERYADSYDTIISAAASKTFGVVQIAKNEAAPIVSSLLPAEPPPARPIETARGKRSDARSDGFFGINKYLLAATIVLITISLGLYFWAENLTQEENAAVVASNIDLTSSGLSEHLRNARGSAETFYGIVQPSWEMLSPEAQDDVLKRSYEFAAGKGFKRVNLLNAKGRSVGFAGDNRREVVR